MTKSVKLLNAYSHSVQAADLLLWRTAALAGPMRAPKPSTKPPWSLRERLDEREIAELITAYRNGATTAFLATAHGVSLSSVNASYAPLVSAARHPPEDPRRPDRPPRINSQVMLGHSPRAQRQ
jgi:hypothetical protein